MATAANPDRRKKKAGDHLDEPPELAKLLDYLRMHRMPTPRRAGPSAWNRVRNLWRVARHAIYLALKETPLLLAVLFVVFVTGEAWQFFGRLHDQRFAGMIVAFIVATFLALLLGLRRERLDCYGVLLDKDEQRVKRPDAFRNKETHEVEKTLRQLERKLADGDFGLTMDTGRLSQGVCREIGAIEMARLCFNVAAVGLATAAFFVVVGVVAIDEQLTEAWITRTGEEVIQQAEVWHVPFVASDVIVSDPLLRVSAVLGAFAALTFAVRIPTDQSLRAELVTDRLQNYKAAAFVWKQLYCGADAGEPAIPSSATGDALPSEE